jgi:hypothetical protein
MAPEIQSGGTISTAVDMFVSSFYSGSDVTISVLFSLGFRLEYCCIVLCLGECLILCLEAALFHQTLLLALPTMFLVSASC